MSEFSPTRSFIYHRSRPRVFELCHIFKELIYFAWRQSMQQSPLFKCIAIWVARLLGQCIAVDTTLLLTMYDKGSEIGFLWLEDTSHIKKHVFFNILLVELQVPHSEYFLSKCRQRHYCYCIGLPNFVTCLQNKKIAWAEIWQMERLLLLTFVLKESILRS